MLIGEGIICHSLTEIKQVTTTQYGLDIKSFRLGVCHKIAFCRLLLRGVAVKAGHCHCHGNVIDCVCVLFSSYILESKCTCWCLTDWYCLCCFMSVCLSVCLPQGLVHVGDELREVNGNLIIHKRPDEISQILVGVKLCSNAR